MENLPDVHNENILHLVPQTVFRYLVSGYNAKENLCIGLSLGELRIVL